MYCLCAERNGMVCFIVLSLVVQKRRRMVCSLCACCIIIIDFNIFVWWNIFLVLESFFTEHSAVVVRVLICVIWTWNCCPVHDTSTNMRETYVPLRVLLEFFLSYTYHTTVEKLYIVFCLIITIFWWVFFLPVPWFVYWLAWRVFVLSFVHSLRIKKLPTTIKWPSSFFSL